MKTRRNKPKVSGYDVVPTEIWRQYEGKVIVYSEEEKQVIGVGDTEEEAYARAEESGVGGLWHVHHAARWGVPQIGSLLDATPRPKAP